ncbi:hypothetical protein LKL35_08630 [Streptomyces sp. ET3-23]|uniref:hypothetical protein n=1 Tax=Streptomyces sp. ET3-23 TaxID=2885643 RepID=UPI001D121268|nr:hypothetical protein [Streptomyces sp. ET3-23]MCC2275486.1 hypothetical protein [Streptomyces sp. ET3-23]
MNVILTSDPHVAAIPIEECGEPLVDVRACRDLLVGGLKSEPAGHFAHLRQAVLERLLHAQSQLPAGLRLLFAEGCRPPQLQRSSFEKYAGELRAGDPNWSEEQIRSPARAEHTPAHRRGRQSQ